jgi:hypothetical protein
VRPLLGEETRQRRDRPTEAAEPATLREERRRLEGRGAFCRHVRGDPQGLLLPRPRAGLPLTPPARPAVPRDLLWMGIASAVVRSPAIHDIREDEHLFDPLELGSCLGLTTQARQRGSPGEEGILELIARGLPLRAQCPDGFYDREPAARSLRRHCPDQVMEVAVRSLDLSASQPNLCTASAKDRSPRHQHCSG